MANSTEETIGIEGTKPIAYIALGSNLGDRESNLREAITQFKAIGTIVTHESSIYETEPVGYKDQSWFLNQVIETTFSDTDDFGADEEAATRFKAMIDADHDGAASVQAGLLLAALLRIEHAMGRERSIPNGPRIIDIDMLLFGNVIIDQRADQNLARCDLIIPHPRMHMRRFVLEPLCEIAPHLAHPKYNRQLTNMLADLTESDEVRLYKRVRHSF